MASAVHQFFITQALHLREGRIDALARAYSTPLVVALPGVEPGYVILSTRNHIEHFFQLKHDGLREAGVPYLRATVTQTQATGHDRLTAMVDWYYLTESGDRAGTTSARYFLERRRGAFSVHMIEFATLAFPSLVGWFQEAGKPSSRPSGHHLLH